MSAAISESELHNASRCAHCPICLSQDLRAKAEAVVHRGADLVDKLADEHAAARRFSQAHACRTAAEVIRRMEIR